MVYMDPNPRTHDPVYTTRASGVPSRRKHSHRYVDSILDRLATQVRSEYEERALQTWSRKRPANGCVHPSSPECPRHEVLLVR